MRDTTTISRPYFREGTDALASLVATRPARDVLLNVAAELVHRERPAARRLAAEVAALLSGVASIAPVAAPVAPEPVQMVVIPCQVSDPFRTDPGCFPGYVNGTREVPADHPAAIAHAEPVTAKPARKPAAAKVKRPGDIGWKPRSLDQIARTAGLAPMSWDTDTLAVCRGNGLLAHRKHGLMARGFERGGPAGDGCTTWKRGADRILVGPYGALYLADGTMRQLPREERDAITEDGRAGVAAAVIEARRVAKRNAAEVKHRVARMDMIRFRRLVRTGKTSMTEAGRRDAMRGKVGYAWRLRAEARAI
jgi:hypothetical protein